MMIAVLIDAVKPGSSGWVAVRHARKIKVSGVFSGDALLIHSKPENSIGGSVVSLNGEPFEIDIPPVVTSVKAEIVKVGEGSRISIDLE